MNIDAKEMRIILKNKFENMYRHSPYSKIQCMFPLLLLLKGVLKGK
jgi:hypothetical protein